MIYKTVIAWARYDYWDHIAIPDRSWEVGAMTCSIYMNKENLYKNCSKDWIEEHIDDTIYDEWIIYYLWNTEKLISTSDMYLISDISKMYFTT